MCLPGRYCQAKVRTFGVINEARPSINRCEDPPRPAFLSFKQRTNNSVGNSALPRLAQLMGVDRPSAAGIHQGRELKNKALQLPVDHRVTENSQTLALWSILNRLSHAFSSRPMETLVIMASPALSSMTLQPTDAVRHDRQTSKSLPTMSPSD